MEDLQKYYKNTENDLPYPMLKKFINMNVKPQKAIDLGCGAGRDTIYLIKNGWKVLAIDKENTREIISQKLNSEEIKKFEFKLQNFESIELEKNNLVVADLSIPFCNKKYFKDFWNKITQSIQNNGYFVGNFFGLNDSWAKDKDEILFLSKNQVIDLFENLFDIITFYEFEKDGKTGLGKEKHWHIYNVIAKRK